MAPSDEDIRDLWKAMDEMKGTLSANANTLARIEAMLSERCTIRGKTMNDLEKKVDEMTKKLWWMGGAASVVATLAVHFLKLIGGSHG